MNENSPERRVTLLLSAIGRGDARATDELLPLVYEELRRLAERRMAGEPAGHTLQATALVHEAYLRLVGGGEDVAWQNRAHFFGSAARAMRRILVERARRAGSGKRGGGRERVDADAAELLLAAPDDGALDLLSLDEALAKLEAFDADLARLVMLRYFAGLGVEETASALGVSPRTVKRDWSVAKAWLFRAMTGEAPRGARPERGGDAGDA